MTQMSGDSLVLPRRPFFNCDDAGFSVVDADELRTALRGGEVTPWLKLDIGEQNIIQHRPRRVVERTGSTVAVECGGGVTVYLDLDAGAARKRTPEGEFLYRGGIDEGNDGNGFIAAG